MSSPVVSIVDVSRTIGAHGTEAVLLAPVRTRPGRPS